ncbi:hypothetical protein E4U32_007467 [Claviceps aff. humidiphila group G2b]|nr:hypothetical protein E4U32_007467 [Claviceps aff. humidiphila group G2b]
MPEQTHNHFHGLGAVRRDSSAYEAGGKANDSCQQHGQQAQHRQRCHQYHQHQHQQSQNDQHQNGHYQNHQHQNHQQQNYHQTHHYQHQYHPNQYQSYQNHQNQHQPDQNHPNQGHQHLYGTAKYTIDDEHSSCSAWRSQSSSAARYNDMNRLFAAWFPETAIELARRSEPKHEFVPENHLEDVDALAANATALYPSNQMSSSVDNSLLTPVFLDGGPTVPMLPPDGVDDMFAINAPLLDYRDMLLASGPDIDIRNWYTTDWDAGTVMRQDLIRQQGGGIIDLPMTSAGLPPVERQDMAMARLTKDIGETDAKESAPVRMRRVRKGLAELETCLRAHVKDQLLQMRECH